MTCSRCVASGFPCSTTSSTRCRRRSSRAGSGTRCDERLGPRGERWVELDEESVRDAARQIRDEGVEAVAIALLHAYADDEHERRVEEIVRAAVGEDVYVTRSSEILPEIREYERTSTTVVNAYVGPAITRYLGSLVERLREAGIEARARRHAVERWDADPETASALPAHLIESGPAAGVMACSYLGAAHGPRPAHLARHGRYHREGGDRRGRAAGADQRVRGRRRHQPLEQARQGRWPPDQASVHRRLRDRRGRGQHRLGRRARRRSRVGPQSAGAVPGPACYGIGGEEPTLTDALARARVSRCRRSSAAARSRSTPERAREALDRVVATPLGRSVEDAAYGVLLLAVATMTRAVKAVTTYRGRDPRDFTLCAFGGNGPLTGVEVARALGIRQVLVPPAPGVFSALGLLFSDTEHEVVRTLMLRGAESPANGSRRRSLKSRPRRRRTSTATAGSPSP